MTSDLDVWSTKENNIIVAVYGLEIAIEMRQEDALVLAGKLVEEVAKCSCTSSTSTD